MSPQLCQWVVQAWTCLLGMMFLRSLGLVCGAGISDLRAYCLVPRLWKSDMASDSPFQGEKKKKLIGTPPIQGCQTPGYRVLLGAPGSGAPRGSRGSRRVVPGGACATGPARTFKANPEMPMSKGAKGTLASGHLRFIWWNFDPYPDPNTLYDGFEGEPKGNQTFRASKYFSDKPT